MEVYLVGGAVRDQLLKLPIKERDWVVVGATGQELLDLGYRPVGKAFPVFLHPKTGEEYALARTERKTGRGYYGFECYAAVDVSLADDLKRRDLTINAIAQTADGEIIDPYGGCDDIKARILRHVSPAFTEDPLRILRVARFAARFHKLGFKIAEETQLLMKQMVASKEVEHLVPDRVWQEVDRALGGEHPEIFMQVLNECGAWPVLFPQLKIQSNVISTFTQVSLCLKRSKLNFSALMLLFGVDIHQLNELSQHYPLPRAYDQLARLLIEFYPLYLQSILKTSESILTLFEKTDVYRRIDRFKDFLSVSECVALQQDKQSERDHADFLLQALESVNQIEVKDIIGKEMKGPQIRQSLQQAREKKLNQFLADEST